MIEAAGQEKKELGKEIQDAMQDMCRKMQLREQFSRLWEIRDSQKQRFFERGIQHLVWNGFQKSFQVDQSGATSGGDSNASEQPNYEDNFNIYLGYEKSFCAVFTQNQASCRAEPDDPKEAMDIAAAREAEKYKRVIEKHNQHKEMQRQIARLLWTDRRVVSWTRYVVDGKRFGTDAQGNPNGNVVTDIYGTLESKVPICSRGLHEWPYCQLASEIDITTAKDRYTDIADKITGSLGGSDIELVARNARIAVNEGTFFNAASGDTTEYLCTESHVWFRPAFYKTQAKEVEAQLLEEFPDGVMATFVDSIFAKATAAVMDDELKIMLALPGDGQSRVSIGACMVPVQENFNDLMNQCIECYDYVIPAKWVDESVVDIDAIQEQEAQRGAYYPAERKNAEPLESAFFEETGVTIPPDMARFMESLSGELSQFLTAQQPSLFGGEMGKAGETAKGYQMAATQALGVMGLIWTPYTVFYAGVMAQSVKAAAKARLDNGETVISSQLPRKGRNGNEVVDIDIRDLASGNFKFNPEVDAQFPESWSQQRAVYMDLLEKSATNPELGAQLMQPDNLALAKDMIGVEGFVIEGAESRDKQLAEIDEMIKGPGPMPPPNTDPLNPVAEVSSIPIDPIFDDHAVEFAEVKRYLNSPEGQKLKVEQPPQFQDIRLHGLEHQQALQQQQLQAQLAQAAQNPQPEQPNV